MEWLTVDLVPISDGGLPQHDTSEDVGVLRLVLGDQGIGLRGIEVVVLVDGKSVNASRQSKVELDTLVVRVRFQPVSPSIEGESSARLVKVLVSLRGRAEICVVELREDKIERYLVDGVGETGIGNDTLRG